MAIDYADRYFNYFLTHTKPHYPEAKDFAEAAEQQMHKVRRLPLFLLSLLLTAIFAP